MAGQQELCRMCLRIDLVLFEMKKSNLEEYYLQLTGVVPRSEPALPQAVCGFCAHQLRKFLKLQQSARLANDTLHRLLSEHGRLSEVIDVKPQSHNLKHRVLPPISIYPSEDVAAENFDPISVVEIAIEPDGLLKKECTDESIFENIDQEVQEANDEFDLDKAFDSDVDDVFSDMPAQNISDEVMVEIQVSDVSNTKVDKPKSAKKSANPRSRHKSVRKLTKSNKKQVKKDELNSHFTMKQFSPQEQRANVESRQESENYRFSSYHCEICFRGFCRQSTFDMHMKKHNDVAKYGEYLCPACGLRFISRTKLGKHIANSHKTEYRCRSNNCSYMCYSRCLATTHALAHQGLKLACPHCNVTYDKKSSYFSHLRLAHPSAEHVCALCGYSFLSLHGVNSHHKLKHRYNDHQIPADAPSCEVCDIKFISEEALRTHQRVSPKHHVDGKKSRNEAPTRVSLKRDIFCEQCGVPMANARAYSFHFRAEHPGLNRTRYLSQAKHLMCDVCGKICLNISNLRDHMKIHTTVGNTCQCNLCPKAFKTTLQLRNHKRNTHEQKKDTGGDCNVCGKTIKHATNLRRHMLLHRTERPYACSLCSQRFATKDHRNSHHRHKHLGVPYLKKRRPAPRTEEVCDGLSSQEDLQALELRNSTIEKLT